MLSDENLRELLSQEVITRKALLMNGVNHRLLEDTHNFDLSNNSWRKKQGSSGQRTASEQPTNIEPFRLKLRTSEINLSTMIAVYDRLAVLNLGGVCFADLLNALQEEGVHICNDIPTDQPYQPSTLKDMHHARPDHSDDRQVPVRSL